MNINHLDSMRIWIMAAMSAAGSAIVTALGGWDYGLQTLLICMAIDYVSGITCALIWHRSPKSPDGRFESKASLKGLIRKGSMLLVVLVAAQLDNVMGTKGACRTAVIFFFIANEGLSFVETLGIMGVNPPPALKKAFTMLNDKSDLKETETKKVK